VKVVLQRVTESSVSVDGELVGSIGLGLLLLVGMAPGDDEKIMRAMAGKITTLRIFDDASGKMNLSLLEAGGGVLAVSQFTLFADCRKGRRPSYSGAAPAEEARGLFEQFVHTLKDTGARVETGRFQAMMDVHLHNWGPVTIVLDSNEGG
jgi:D-tyrosyl-tRNA(Tyr) deacylase